MKKSKENLIGSFYDRWSERIAKNDFVNETLAIHFGFYTKGIKTYKDAVLNMNEYVAELLKLENKKGIKILDAGCGIGGSSIHLAKKYPNVSFTGITNAPYQIKLATIFAKNHNIPNVNFMFGDYQNTEFPDNTFDGIFAIESACYSQDHQALLNEMNRILKQCGRLVIIDVFLTPRPLNIVMKKIYQRFCYNSCHLNLATIPKYKEFLKVKGFTEVYIKDISKNVMPSVFYFSIKSLLNFSIRLAKKIFYSKKNNKNKDFFNHMRGNASIWIGIFGLCKVVSYHVISAAKK